MKPHRKISPRAAHLLRQREQIEASPLITERFPGLKALKVTLEYFNATGTRKNGEMKCTLNVEQSRSMLWFACRGGECAGGDFNLGAALAKAIAGRCRMASGELRCQGTRRRGDEEGVPCQMLLRYRLNLNYD